jgi:L-rhamnose mutarotase
MIDMQYFGLTLELKDDPDVIAKYKEYHAHPWPEPLDGAKEVGVIA